MRSAAAVQIQGAPSAKLLKFPGPKPTPRKVKFIKLDGIQVSLMGIREKTSLRTGRPVWEVQIREGKKVVFFKGGIEAIRDAVKVRDDALKARNEPLSATGAMKVNGELTLCGKRDAHGNVIEPGLFQLYMGTEKLGQQHINHFNRFINNPVLQRATVADLGPDLMLAWAKSRKAIGLKNSSIGTEYGIFGRAIKVFIRNQKWRNFQPLDDVRSFLLDEKLVKKSGGRKQMPTMAQFRALINWFEAHDIRARQRTGGRRSFVNQADILKWSGLQGTRVSETFALKLRDLREDEKRGTATMGLFRKDSEGDDVNAKGARTRWEPAMPLVQEAYAVLKQQPTYKAWKALTPMERMKSDLVVFPGSQHYTSWTLWNRARIECGVPELHWHDLRARAITNLCKVMLPTRVKAYSGHKTLSSLEVYIRLAEEDLDESAKLTASIKLPT